MKALHRQLLAWYDREKRDLPWRRSRDPYQIWISEIMLQQTRVETVLPYFARFLSNFPTVKDLAAADTDKLLNLWAGLGYYSRARNLKAAAEDMVARFDGEVPRNHESLRSLKGIGPYTAAAIASIAFDQAHPAIDGNLERVFARLLALRTNPKTEGRAAVTTFGQRLVDLGRAGDVNQAVMDLSAKVCVPREPRCLACPIQSHCLAFREGSQNEIPVKKEKKAPIELKAAGLIVLAEGELLLARRPQGEWLAGMWDLPWWVETAESKTLLLDSAQEFARSEQKRTITKHKITFQVRAFALGRKPKAQILEQLPAPAAEFRWVKLSDLHGVNLPRPSERALEQALSKQAN